MKRAVLISSGIVVLLVLPVLPNLDDAKPSGDHKDFPELACTTIIPGNIWIENMPDESPGEIWNQMLSLYFRRPSDMNFKSYPCFRLTQHSVLSPLFLDRPPPGIYS